MSDDARDKGWKRPILIVLATAPVFLAVGSFVILGRTQLAFDDETRCPFVEEETRTVREGVTVREDARECVDGIEERRGVLPREGRPTREIGRRRLDSRYFEAGYAWEVREEEGRVRLEIRSPDQEPRVFREPAPDAGTS